MSAKDRKGSRDKRKNNGNALAGTLFTAAMICCCVLIYLLSIQRRQEYRQRYLHGYPAAAYRPNGKGISLG